MSRMEIAGLTLGMVSVANALWDFCNRSKESKAALKDIEQAKTTLALRKLDDCEHHRSLSQAQKDILETLARTREEAGEEAVQWVLPDISRCERVLKSIEHTACQSKALLGFQVAHVCSPRHGEKAYQPPARTQSESGSWISRPQTKLAQSDPEAPIEVLKIGDHTFELAQLEDAVLHIDLERKDSIQRRLTFQIRLARNAFKICSAGGLPRLLLGIRAFVAQHPLPSSSSQQAWVSSFSTLGSQSDPANGGLEPLVPAAILHLADLVKSVFVGSEDVSNEPPGPLLFACAVVMTSLLLAFHWQYNKSSRLQRWLMWIAAALWLTFTVGMEVGVELSIFCVFPRLVFVALVAGEIYQLGLRFCTGHQLAIE